MNTVNLAADATAVGRMSADAAAVRQTALDYVERRCKANGDRVARALLPTIRICEAKQIMKQVNLLGRKALLTVDPFRFIRSDKIIKIHAANISAVSRKLRHIASRFTICLKASLGFGA